MIGEQPEGLGLVQIKGELIGTDQEQFPAHPCGFNARQDWLDSTKQRYVEAQRQNHQELIQQQTELGASIDHLVIIDHQQGIVVERCSQFVHQSLKGQGNRPIGVRGTHRKDAALIKLDNGAKRGRQVAEEESRIIIGMGPTPGHRPTTMGS
jgi:hypothetical protein